jgi:uncharacterized protein (TIGR01777 family)
MPAMRIAISGSSGLIGTALRSRLHDGGHEIVRLRRAAPGAAGPSEIAWDPDAGTIDAARLEGLDAVVHLGGVSLATWPWTRVKKARIWESRVASTSLLAHALGGLARPPRALLSASAVGYYGDRGDERLDESSPAGRGFLASLCVAWEAATEAATRAGIRVARLRTGLVLSRSGGTLGPLALPFRLGLGGPVGDGRQYMSWITLDDAVSAIVHLLGRDDVSGPVNVAAPGPVPNAEFARALGRALGRPSWLPLPAWAARLALGEMADELLLAGQRAVPARLGASGFTFRHPEIGAALEALVR